MHIMFDISRLLTRGLYRTPTGIDRLDLAYATHLAEGHSKVSFCFGRQPEKLRVTIRATLPYSGRSVEAIPAAEPHFESLCALLANPALLHNSRMTTRLRPARTRFQPALDTLAKAWRPNPRAQALPQNLNGIIYLHTSHFGLEMSGALATPKARGARVVALLHDLIPLDYPEYSRPGEAERHENRLKNIQANADLVLVNSNYTQHRLRTWANSQQLVLPPVRVVPLGVAPRYQTRLGLRPPVSARPYFVMVGTLEPRKNHVFMLTLWRRLASELGPQCPVLVIVGKRGWEMEAAADLLERCPSFSSNVIEINGLSDFSVASLILGAHAVLQPSLVEGFGLPVAEAQALGIPVIASDVEAHREIAAPDTALIDPLDGPGWLAQIRLHLAGPPKKAPSTRPALDQSTHVALALDAINSLL